MTSYQPQRVTSGRLKKKKKTWYKTFKKEGKKEKRKEKKEIINHYIFKSLLLLKIIPRSDLRTAHSPDEGWQGTAPTN